MGDSLTNSLGLVAALDPRALALLVLVCAIGELAIGVPYVLESIWLLVGFYLGASMMSVWQVGVLWAAAQFGRQVGSICLYYVGRSGAGPVAKLYHKLRLSRFIPKAVLNSSVVDRVSRPSPFSIAFGRLLGLRVPLALLSAGRHELRPLLIGVFLSSVVWDGVYIIVGLAVGTKTTLKPLQMLLISLGGLTVLYLMTFLVRRLIRRLKPATSATSHSMDSDRGRRTTASSQDN